MSELNPIRVLVVDDHALVRRGVSSFLATFEDLALVGAAESGAEALWLCEQLQPDVVLMDLVMPELDGIAVTRMIRERQPGIQVIILTVYGQPEFVQGALQAGAISYLLKDTSPYGLAEAIRKAHAGVPTLAPQAAQALIEVATRPPAPEFNLTLRERQVLALMIEGLNNPDIAQRLVVSRSTIKAHVSSILAKLGVDSRIEAVAYAIQYHLVT